MVRSVRSGEDLATFLRARHTVLAPVRGSVDSGHHHPFPCHPFTAWALRGWLLELTQQYGWSVGVAREGDHLNHAHHLNQPDHGNGDWSAPLFVNAIPLVPPTSSSSSSIQTAVQQQHDVDDDNDVEHEAEQLQQQSQKQQDTSSMAVPVGSGGGLLLRHRRRQLRKVALKRDAICKIMTAIKQRSGLPFDRHTIAMASFRVIDDHDNHGDNGEDNDNGDHDHNDLHENGLYRKWIPELERLQLARPRYE